MQKQEVQKAMQPDNGKEICQRIGAGAGLLKKKKKRQSSSGGTCLRIHVVSQRTNAHFKSVNYCSNSVNNLKV